MKTNRLGMKIIGEADPKAITAAEALVMGAIPIELKDNEFAALVSFAMSVRACDFTRSKLVRLVNRGRFIEASREFPLWVTTGGKVRKSLISRRKKEAALFLMPEVVVNNAKVGQ